MKTYTINDEKVINVKKLIDFLIQCNPESFVCFSLGEKVEGGEQAYYLNGFYNQFTNEEPVYHMNEEIVILFGSNSHTNLKEIDKYV